MLAVTMLKIKQAPIERKPVYLGLWVWRHKMTLRRQIENLFRLPCRLWPLPNMYLEMYNFMKFCRREYFSEKFQENFMKLKKILYVK